MKKLLLIFSVILLLGCAYAGEYSTVNVNGVDFEIPSKYSGGELENKKYVYNDLRTFAVFCVDDYIVSNYGGYASTCDFIEETSINDRPCMLLTTYNKYIKTNVSYLYFPVNKSVYCISFQSDNVTSEISHIVESAPEQNMSSDTFYGLLDESVEKYKERQFIDASSDDSYYSIAQLNSHEKNNRDDQLIKWFILTRS